MVGIWNTFFGYAAFIGLNCVFSNAFVETFYAYMPALILANGMAILNAYICHKYFTFRSDVAGKDIFFEFFRFASTYLFTFCLTLVLMPLCVEVLSITPQVAGAIAILICTIIGYIGHSRFSFRHWTKYDGRSIRRENGTWWFVRTTAYGLFLCIRNILGCDDIKFFRNLCRNYT